MENQGIFGYNNRIIQRNSYMKIWIATGGTGGHIFPALAVASELKSRDHKITISTDARGSKMVRKNKPKNARVVHVWASGVGGKSKLKQVVALLKIAVSAKFLFLRFLVLRPDRVVAFGGYASVPAVFAAHILKIPTYLHEQNAAIGRANKFAMRWVKTLMTSFEKVSGIPTGTINIEYTGLPVRSAIMKYENSPLTLDSKILITGGSLGAQILDEVCPIAIAALKNKKIFVTHQTRPENVAKLQQFYAANKIRANVLSFINDMAAAIADADLIIGRSGASTVAELQTIGRPAILVPLSINPDQGANAESFASSGGGFAIAQNKFTPKWLTATLSDLLSNGPRLEKMASKAYVPNNAVDKIVDVILN